MLEKLISLSTESSSLEDRLSQIHSEGIIHGYTRARLGLTMKSKFVVARPVLASYPAMRQQKNLRALFVDAKTKLLPRMRQGLS